MTLDALAMERSITAAANVADLAMTKEECAGLAHAMVALRDYSAAQRASQALQEQRAALLHGVFAPRSRRMTRSDLDKFAAAQQEKLDALALEHRTAWAAEKAAFEACLDAASRAYAWAEVEMPKCVRVRHVPAPPSKPVRVVPVFVKPGAST